jgi:cytochrome c biogenesis protein ResB
MWDRGLFAVRRLTVDLGGRLGSWRLSIVLMVVAALYYGLLAIWATSSPPHVVRNIASLVPFWLVYGLLLVNTGVCLWNRLPTLRKDLSRRPRWSERSPDWIVEARDGLDPEEVRGLLRRFGYRPAWEEPGRVGGVRKRWAALGTYLFHGAFFLLALGLLLTLLTRQEAKVWVAVGEQFESRADQFLSTSPPRLLAAGVASPSFGVERITPEFWEDQLLFTRLEADLEFPGGSAATTRINRPLWVGAATFLRLSGFGYTPRYELLDREGALLDSAFVKLNVFPPGKRDYFTLPDYPHRFYLEVLPDFELEEGVPVTRSLNLAKPGVVLRVFRGRLDLGGAVLVADEGFEFEGLTLRFPEIRYWGEFSVVRDAGVPILFAGYLLGFVGLLLKLRGRREEAEWRADPEGGCGTLAGWGGSAPRGMKAVEAARS